MPLWGLCENMWHGFVLAVLAQIVKNDTLQREDILLPPYSNGPHQKQITTANEVRSETDYVSFKVYYMTLVHS